MGEARFEDKSDGGHQNMLVSDSYATHVMKWLMRRIFVLKGIPLLPFILLFLLLTPSSPQYSEIISVYFQEKTLGLTQLPDPTQVYFPTKSVIECVYNLYGKHPSTPHQPQSHMGHCTTGMSMCVCMYGEGCSHFHVVWSTWTESECEGGREAAEGGWGERLRQ